MTITEHLINDISNNRLYSKIELLQLTEISRLEGKLEAFDPNSVDRNKIVELLENEILKFKQSYVPNRYWSKLKKHVQTMKFFIM